MIELDGVRQASTERLYLGTHTVKDSEEDKLILQPPQSITLTEGSTCSTFPPMLSYFFLLFPLPLVKSKPEFQGNVSREESAREW